MSHIIEPTESGRDCLGTRAVPEWIADHPDQEIPKRVKLRIWERCRGRCAISGRKVLHGEGDFDHIIALACGGQHRESNLQLVIRDGPHKEKTAEDVRLKAKIARQSAKDKGLWPKSKRPLKSRGFAPSRGRP